MVDEAQAGGNQQATARKSLSREAWLQAAVKVLERKGIAAVKADTLARQLKVTRGSFYFHFKSLKDLHDGLADLWRQYNCQPFEALADSPLVGEALFGAVIRVMVDEKPFSPSLDLAVRDWGRSSRQLAAEMEATDAFRVSLFIRSFQQMGYNEDESVVRARITYLHQIGYYAVGFTEPVAERKRYQPIYGRVLVGAVGGRS